MGGEIIYLDNAATTRPNPRALARAEAFAVGSFYNPSARYGCAVEVAAELRRARETLLSPFGEDFEAIFTSGGTEGDNHAVFSGGRRGNVVTTAGEHAAVREACTELKNRGAEPRFAPLERDGSVNKEALLSLVDERTSLVSVVHVNNETGAVNDIAALARAVKQKNPRCLFHSDGVQAYGKLLVRLPKEIDLYTASAHKIGGLKGTGMLVKRRSLALQPLLFGGGQEGNRRSGTENVLGILSFAYAAEEALCGLMQNAERAARCRDILARELDPSLFVPLSPKEGSPYIYTVAARGLRGEVLQHLLEGKGVIVGTGSACSSKKPYSAVIEACGVGKELLHGVLRTSFCFDTREEDVLFAARAMNESARELNERLNG